MGDHGVACPFMSLQPTLRSGGKKTACASVFMCGRSFRDRCPVAARMRPRAGATSPVSPRGTGRNESLFLVCSLMGVFSRETPGSAASRHSPACQPRRRCEDADQGRKPDPAHARAHDRAGDVARRPVSRVLSAPCGVGRPFLWDTPHGAPHATNPGGGTGMSPRPGLSADAAAPIRSCSRWGLPCHPCHQGRGALLPHRFTRARGASRPHGRFVFCGTVPGVAPAGG